MKKIKLITSLATIATASIALLPIASCSQEQIVEKDITVTNSSDKIYISFDSVPESWKTNNDLELTFSLTENYKIIDRDNSKVLVNDTDIKLYDGVILTDSKLFIPGKYITDNLTISLQVMDITYRVVNESDKNIVFDNLPSEIVLGWSINVNYTINNDQLIDTAKSDIKVKGVSIKNEYGVIWDNNYLQIPGKYTTGLIELQLVLRDKKSCTIDTSGCSGITLSTITSPVIEQTEIKATYTIDESTQVIDKVLSDVLVDGISIAKKTGVKYLDKEIYIPKELVTGNVTIKIVTESAKLIDQDWSTIIDAVDQYEIDKDESAFLDNFTIDGVKPTSLNELIGAKKAIKFAFYDNTSQTTTYKEQLVRIIGVNHDTISQTNDKAALTFQLVNLLSSPDGNSMRCIYDSNEKNTYIESDLHYNLNHREYGYATWYDQNNKKIEKYTDSVYYMLLQGQPELINSIKTVDKYVNFDYGTYEEPNWKETQYPLMFFPMTFKEMNLVKDEGEPEVETTNPTYAYWTSYSTESDRIMKDENNNSWYYWLSSPYASGHAFAWNISDKGVKNHAVTKTERFGVSFGFAI